MEGNNHNGNWRMWRNRPYYVRTVPVIVNISPDAIYLQRLSNIVSNILNNVNTGCLIGNDNANTILVEQATVLINSSTFQNTANRDILLSEFNELKSLIDSIKENGCTPDRIRNQIDILVRIRTDLYNMYNNRYVRNQYIDIL